MAFPIVCPSCQSQYSATDEMAGRRMRCPKCGEAIVVTRPEKTPDKAPPQRRQPVPPQRPRASDDDETSSSEPVKLNMRREVVDAQMDMTPMVDVTFLLLIFFMVTAAFSMQKSLEIPKPKQDEQPSTVTQQQNPEDDPSYVTVFVDEFSTYRVITVDWDVEAPSEQELLRKLREARDSENTPTKLLVKAHGDSLHEKVIAALDAGTEVGMEQVQLMTVEESE